jgi:hypothetical protein
MGVNERSGSFSGDYEADISVGATDIKVTQEKGRGQRAEGRGQRAEGRGQREKTARHKTRPLRGGEK